MSRLPEPLEVPMGRTLFALWKWERKDAAQRLTVDSAAAADFALRFPLILDRLYTLSGKPLGVRAAAAQSERMAPESDQLTAQHLAWPTRHRLVIGALVGRGLADLAPSLGSQRVEITPRGVKAALELQGRPGWSIVADRATSLGKLRLSPTTLVERCRQVASDPR
jgi:hypothetical protein